MDHQAGDENIKSRKLIYSPLADQDLLDIFVYIARHNLPAASRLVSDIVAKTEWIATTGFLGAPRDHLSLGLRALPYRDRCIYFRVDDSSVRILRIVHGRQDISPEDFTESSI